MPVKFFYLKCIAVLQTCALRDINSFYNWRCPRFVIIQTRKGHQRAKHSLSLYLSCGIWLTEETQFARIRKKHVLEARLFLT